MASAIIMRLNQILLSSPTSSFQTHLITLVLSLTSSKYSRQFFAVLRISSLSVTVLLPSFCFQRTKNSALARRAHFRFKNGYGNQPDKITRFAKPINIMYRLFMIFSLANRYNFVNITNSCEYAERQK